MDKKPPSIFIVKKSKEGLCIINTNNNTITYSNGFCETINQWNIDIEINRWKWQNKRGTLL